MLQLLEALDLDVNGLIDEFLLAPAKTQNVAGKQGLGKAEAICRQKSPQVLLQPSCLRSSVAGTFYPLLPRLTLCPSPPYSMPQEADTQEVHQPPPLTCCY